MQNLLFALIFTFGFHYSNAQPDTVLQLPAIEIKADRLEKFAIGGNIQQFSTAQLSSYQNQNLDKLLQEQSGIYIRSFGAGSLATASARGGGFGHTAVIWNGFNLQSSMNGGTDILLFPILNFQKVQLQYGGSSSLSGNGAIGASIFLDQNISLDHGLQVQAGIVVGSFKEQRQSVQLHWSGQKAGSQLSVYHQSADNDFEYENGSKTLRLENANGERAGLMFNHRLKLNKTQNINIYSWYQYNHRNIPPSLTAATDNAQQEDNSLRTAAEWTAIFQLLTLKARAAYLLEDIYFKSNLVSSPTLTQTFDVQTEADIKIGAQHLTGGIQLIEEFARAEAAFSTSKSRQRLAAFGAWQLPLRNVVTGLSIRQEIVDGELVPLTFTAGAEGQISKFWKWRFSSSRNYHLPTFNDLYWEGAGGVGNPLLESETGWSVEGGLTQNKSISNLTFYQHFNIFSNHIDNWILWSPISPLVWTPDNVQKVWSRGAEYRMRFAFEFVDWKMDFQAQYSFTKTTNQRPYESGNENTNYLQLPLTPQHLAILSFGGEYKSCRLNYLHRLSGSQFADRLHTEQLPFYTLGQLTLGYHWYFSPNELQLSFVIENLWNANYQVLPFRPMPGRHFRLEVNYGLN